MPDDPVDDSMDDPVDALFHRAKERFKGKPSPSNDVLGILRLDAEMWMRIDALAAARGKTRHAMLRLVAEAGVAAMEAA